MAHTYSLIAIHALFSTKTRARSLDSVPKVELCAYMGGILRNLEVKTLAINAVADHVHLLIIIPPRLSVSEVMAKLKSNSSGWIHDKWPELRDFAWQTGFTAFSVSRSNIPSVKRYVENQEAHHRRMSFEDELVAILQKHGVEYDEKYVFD